MTTIILLALFFLCLSVLVFGLACVLTASVNIAKRGINWSNFGLAMVGMVLSVPISGVIEHIFHNLVVSFGW